MTEPFTPYTREELADFRQTVEAVRDEKSWSQQDRERLLERFGGESDALLRLIAMAERSVRQDTIEALAAVIRNPDHDGERRALLSCVGRDLGPLAKALNEKEGDRR